MRHNNLLVLYVLSLGLALAVLAVYLPWWSIRTSNEAEIVLKGSANIDFQLWQRVSVVLRTTRTRSVVLDISELTSDEGALMEMRNVLDVTSKLALVGVAFVAFLWALTIFSIVKKPLLSDRVFNLLVLIGGIVLLVAPIYMFSTFYPLIPRLERFVSFDFPINWVVISPKNVNFFWGSVRIPDNIGFPSYLAGYYDFWIWGAGAGWLLGLTCALVLFSVAILRWQMVQKKIV